MKIKQQLQCEIARREFWEYCKLKAKDFYKEDREYLKEICQELQDFYYSDDMVLSINLPPRHGKSRTATLFVEWALGKDNQLKIMTGSYNEDLSSTFSSQVRNSIQEQKGDESILVYSEIFPNTKIKYGEAAAKKWALEGNSNKNYLATSPGGTATGFGADFLIIDDLIKSAEECNNAMVLEKHWEWFTNTMLSRLQGKRKVILIMTRWNSKDLCGLAIKHFKEIGIEPRLLSMKAYDGEKMLCDDVLNKQQYDILTKTLGQDIASANYNQEPIDLKGVLYSNFLEYEELPNIKAIENYTDTADEGADYLCSINYAIGIDNNAYILDILFTKESMETTEVKVSEMLIKDNVNFARIESNNGGRGFSRNVERITKDTGHKHTIFKPFHQSANKKSRILTGSTGVTQNIYFPKGWKEKHSEFYQNISTYQREGKNKHDDAEDCLTGVYETLNKKYVKKGNISGLRL